MMLLRWIVLLFVLVTGIGCSRNPNPDLTPDAQIASANGRALQALDLVRDVALVFTNDAGTGQLPLPVARRLVQTHWSSLTLIEARADGYVQIIQASLAEIPKQLSPDMQRRLSPYLSFASTVIGLLSAREIDEQLSKETIEAYQKRLAESLAFDASWLAAHQ
jgi:hypothetical protein